MAKSKKKSKLSPEIRTAIITAVVAVMTALLASPVLIELIRREPTPAPSLNAVTLSIYNEHCLDQDLYVDNLLVATIKPGAQADIQVNAGEHTYYACETGTVNCGGVYYAIWTQNAVTNIPNNPVCASAVVPITITVVNENCQSYDLYLDDYYYSTIYEGETQYFSVEPGAHTAKGCISGTELCSASAQQEWILDSAWTISREATCP